MTSELSFLVMLSTCSTLAPPPPVPVHISPTEQRASPGDALKVTVEVQDAQGIESVDLEIQYDPLLLDIDPDPQTSVHVGTLFANRPVGEVLLAANIDPIAGTVTAGLALVSPRGPGAGSLIQVDFKIRPAAPAGDTPMDLRFVSLNEGGIPLMQEPRPGPDGTDGKITIIPGGGGGFRRGDAEGSGKADLTDAVIILGYLFQGGVTPTCLDALDTTDSGKVDLTDAVFLLAFLFQGGAVPPSPGPFTCGPDTTAGDPFLTCQYDRC